VNPTPGNHPLRDDSAKRARQDTLTQPSGTPRASLMSTLVAATRRAGRADWIGRKRGVPVPRGPHRIPTIGGNPPPSGSPPSLSDHQTTIASAMPPAPTTAPDERSAVEVRPRTQSGGKGYEKRSSLDSTHISPITQMPKPSERRETEETLQRLLPLSTRRLRPIPPGLLFLQVSTS
jgi:hypothetical protein